ncbi:Bug family tripartite tricarboxylate transporter substrate binding protein [Verminephrobacter eiseniae]|uniref:Bug family tripartite tricarboxylate transporter substrate binding protein n=1 Tax=Verminephrobacter eiseniae TaxID=364317 RepID=UPI0022380436|nr:tripartite tricarboxylate transporter substrate binding protein [Verminephrobacter eiseniae]
MKRRLWVLVALLWSSVAWAQDYPNRPIKLVVPFAPGGNIDFIARTLGPKLSEYLGTAIVIDNRAGAGGIIGAAHATTQPPDGYTIFLGNTGTNAIYPAIYAKLPYDPLKDFAPVARTTTNEFLAAVHPGVPANSLKEFIAHAKAHPGKVNAAVAGSGSSSHFAIEMVKREAGIDALVVPYKTSAPALTDLLGGQVQFMLDAPPVTLEYIKSGRLRGMAVTGSTRLASLPDVPTFDEAGLPGINASGFQGVFAPAGTPPAILDKLADAVIKTLAQPEVRERLASQGLNVAPMNPKEFTAFVQAEAPKWAQLAKAANIKAD